MAVSSTGCFFGQLQRTEEQIRILETRLEILDENTRRSYEESEKGLQDLFHGLKKQSDVVQRNQLRMNAQLEDLSKEVLKMRRDLDANNQKAGSLESRLDTAESVLKTDLAKALASLEKDQKSFQAAIRKELADSKAANLKAVKDSESRLEKADASSEAKLRQELSKLKTEIAASFREIENLVRGLGPGDGTVPPKAIAEGFPHVVAKGESLSLIAQDYGVRLQDIIDANGITDPSKLQIGQEIIIPNK